MVRLAAILILLAASPLFLGWFGSFISPLLVIMIPVALLAWTLHRAIRPVPNPVKQPLARVYRLPPRQAQLPHHTKRKKAM